MHFKISKKTFYQALDKVARAISASSPIPALSGIKIVIANNQIELTASDSDMSIFDIVKSDEDNQLVIYKEGSIVIEGKYILDIVRKIDSSTIEVEIADGYLTKISGGNTEFKINGVPTSDYPLIDFSKPQESFKISANDLQKMIVQTSFATTDRENRPILTGVNITVENKELTFAATDSNRLARKTQIIKCEDEINFIIPASSLLKIARIIDKNSEVEIAVSDKKVQFYFEDMIIQNRLIDGIFPDTNRFIPNAFQTIITLDSRDLLNAIDRASFIKSIDGVSIVNFQISENEFIVSSKSQEVGSSVEEIIKYEYEGEPIKISFSGKFLSEAIRAIEGSNIKISFEGEMKPFVVREVDDLNSTHLILPVRTNY
ncbi:MAG: DNA polymerase III subunit beta [Erysipelothrix sp.]|nr:DNA polymerase III subunit beta [Erysipelothrix sp.]